MSFVRILLCAAVFIPLLSACGTGTDKPVPRAYAGPYSGLERLCLLPEEEHSITLDMLVMQALKDRGFSPVYLESGDKKTLSACRAVVSFGTKGDISLEEVPDEMVLTFFDRYTGETYHVGTDAGRREKEQSSIVKSPNTDPDREIRKLVERLFPDSPLGSGGVFSGMP